MSNRLKISLITFVLALFFTLQGVYGQYRMQRSIIHYEDGSVFIGEIFGADQQSMQLRISTGDTITLYQRHIKKLFSTDDVVVFDRGKFHYLNGLFAFGHMGASFSWSGVSTLLGGVVGYRLNEKYSIGFGMGLDYHETIHGGLYLWNDFYSLYGYGRYFLNNKQRRVYADARLGYGMPLTSMNDNFSGGVLFEPGFGILFSSKNRFRIFGGLGYCVQYAEGESMEFDILNNPIEFNYKIWYQRILFRVGLEFH